MQEKPSTIRGTIKGKLKYQRIPIRSKFYEQCANLGEVNAEKILEMDRETASRVIDALVEDWMYWLKRANELYILNQAYQRERSSTENTKER